MLEKDLNKIIQNVVTKEKEYYSKKHMGNKTYKPQHLYKYLLENINHDRMIDIVEKEHTHMHHNIVRALLNRNVKDYAKEHSDTLIEDKNKVHLTDEQYLNLVKDNISGYDTLLKSISKDGLLNVEDLIIQHMKKSVQLGKELRRNRGVESVVVKEINRFISQFKYELKLPIKSKYHINSTYHKTVEDSIKNFIQHYTREKGLKIVSNGLDTIQQYNGISTVRTRLSFLSHNGLVDSKYPVLEIYPTVVIYYTNNMPTLFKIDNLNDMRNLFNIIVRDAKALKISLDELKEMWKYTSKIYDGNNLVATKWM